MFKKSQAIITVSSGSTIEDMCRNILSQAESIPNILKIVFFMHSANDAEYLYNHKTLRKITDEHFAGSTPLVSYVAQKPMNGMLAAEVISLNDNNVSLEHHGQYMLLKKGSCTELVTEGIIPGDVSRTAFEQSNEIFAAIGKILNENGFTPNDIYRQWNYIQSITVLNDGSQNYQEFNDARSIFYSSCNWQGGYPAATGIGTSAGGIMVEVCAIKGEEVPNLPIDNPLQVAAHSYSQKVLDGKAVKQLSEKTTPKFERARLLGNTIFISGTAAIKGEKSNTGNDTVEQAAETMEIMDRLIATDNIPVANNGARYSLLRVYVKRESDIPATCQYMQQHYPAVPKHYLVADICRPELLIEIEGIAHI